MSRYDEPWLPRRAERQPVGEYDTALICMNGHVINSMAQRQPVHNTAYCNRCGAAVVSKCLSCDTGIRGEFYSGGIIFGYHAPAYCHTCGNAFPWTSERLQAARQLALEAEGLSPEERAQLEGTLDDLIRETPRTPLAVQRFKRLVAKSGAAAATTLREVLVDVVSETVKKSIWG
jgi:hypothetical protein